MGLYCPGVRIAERSTEANQRQPASVGYWRSGSPGVFGLRWCREDNVYRGRAVWTAALVLL